MVTLAGEVTARDERYRDWATSVGVEIGTRLDPEAHQAALSEMDAISALFYGMSWEQVVTVFETFHRGWDHTERLAAVQVHFDRWKDSA